MNIHFAIVGCGHIAQRHARHILAQKEARLLGGYDIKAERSEQFAIDFNAKAYGSLCEVLEDENVDIVVVCSPNGTHYDISLQALEAGKHVLIEKPMTICKEHCEDLIRTALDYNRALFVVKQNRFNPPVQAVKQLLLSKKLGQIYSVTINCFWNRNEAYYRQSDWKGTKSLDGGTLFTQYSHFIDIAYYLFGDFEVLQGVTKNANHQSLIDFEDTGHFILRFKKSKAIGSFNYTTAAFRQNMEGSITVFAENGTLKIGGKYLNTIDYQAIKDIEISNLPSSNPANNYGFYEGSMSNHDKVINNVVQALNGREKIMTNAYDGLKVVELIENMYEKAEFLG